MSLESLANDADEIYLAQMREEREAARAAESEGTPVDGSFERVEKRIADGYAWVASADARLLLATIRYATDDRDEARRESERLRAEVAAAEKEADDARQDAANLAVEMRRQQLRLDSGNDCFDSLDEAVTAKLTLVGNLREAVTRAEAEVAAARAKIEELSTPDVFGLDGENDTATSEWAELAWDLSDGGIAEIWQNRQIGSAFIALIPIEWDDDGTPIEHEPQKFDTEAEAFAAIAAARSPSTPSAPDTPVVHQERK